jgi:hypothetical protein
VQEQYHYQHSRSVRACWAAGWLVFSYKQKQMAVRVSDDPQKNSEFAT